MWQNKIENAINYPERLKLPNPTRLNRLPREALSEPL